LGGVAQLGGATAEARAVDSGGKLLAHGTATCIIFGG
jgi:acyl-coenzyme A thioesterase PaaI-like protein